MIPKVPKHFLLTLTVLLAWFTAPLLGQTYVLTLDAEASQAEFLLGATGHDVHGTLYVKSGELRLDTAHGTATGQVVLDAVKTDTGSKSRDKKMHKEVLISGQHPLIAFEAQRLIGEVGSEGSSDFEIAGTMMLIGKKHEMTLPIHIDVEDGTLRGETKFVVPFIEWGLNDPSILFLKVAKEVEVTIKAVGQWTLIQDDASLSDSPEDGGG